MQKVRYERLFPSELDGDGLQGFVKSLQSRRQPIRNKTEWRVEV